MKIQIKKTWKPENKIKIQMKSIPKDKHPYFAGKM